MTFGISVGLFIIVLLLIIAFFVFLYYVPLGLWVRAAAAGVRLGIFSLFRMRVIGIPPSVIVDSLIMARKAGIDVNDSQLQAQYLSGGHLDRVVLALIAAQRAQIPLEWQRACAIALAGRNPLDAVQTSVNPKVIETPIFQGVAKDGIQLNVKARITVRTNMDRYGGSENYKEVLENPDHISKTVLAKGLDAGTAFEIVSIDIADVDVGRNVGADLQTAQAEADRRVAQAKAAERQYAAQAQEQEMKAQTQAMRAKVVEAEALVPAAIADAFRGGNLGVMDYYRMRNVLADTEMRQSLSGAGGTQQSGGSGGLTPPPSSPPSSGS